MFDQCGQHSYHATITITVANSCRASSMSGRITFAPSNRIIVIAIDQSCQRQVAVARLAQVPCRVVVSSRLLLMVVAEVMVGHVLWTGHVRTLQPLFSWELQHRQTQRCQQTASRQHKHSLGPRGPISRGCDVQESPRYRQPRRLDNQVSHSM